MNKAIALLACVFSMCAIAVEHSLDRVEQGKINREKFLRATGGFIMDKRSATGFIAVVNGQSRIPSDFIKMRAEKLEQNVWMRVKYSEPTGSASLQNVDAVVRASQGNVAIVLIDADGLPSLMSIPESKCVVVNVAALANGIDDKTKIKMRLSKEIARALCFVFVVNYSGRPGGLMDPITSFEELDKVLVDGVGLDLMPFIERSAERFGIKRFKRATYQKACIEGWAPPPITDVQKAVWEQVKAEKDQKPSNPIKVNFDPKTAPKVGK